MGAFGAILQALTSETNIVSLIDPDQILCQVNTQANHLIFGNFTLTQCRSDHLDA
jgi:hypothetical protein